MRAANSDLQLLQLLHAYPMKDISAATSRKMANHLWYLSEDLILLSLFDPHVDLATKKAMIKVSAEKEYKATQDRFAGLEVNAD